MNLLRIARVPLVIVALLEVPTKDALGCMTDKYFRHLSIVVHFGKLNGMLSVRNLFENLAHELKGLNAYFGVEGMGRD